MATRAQDAGGGVGVSHAAGVRGSSMAGHDVAVLGTQAGAKVLRRLDQRGSRRARCRRRRRGRRASSATSSSRCGTSATTTRSCTTRSSTDKNHPTVNGDGPIYAVVGRPRPARRARSEREQDVRARHPDARRSAEGPVALPAAAPPSPSGATSICGARRQPGRSAQPDARQQGPRVDDVEDPRERARLVQGRLEQQVRRVVPAHEQRPPGVVLRSEDEASSR